MASFESDILILCKTYPSPSGKHVETSCVAGMRPDGSLIRLFPVPFRLIDGAQQFKKWQWIRARIERAPADIWSDYKGAIDVQQEKQKADQSREKFEQLTGTCCFGESDYSASKRRFAQLLQFSSALSSVAHMSHHTFRRCTFPPCRIVVKIQWSITVTWVGRQLKAFVGAELLHRARQRPFCIGIEPIELCINGLQN